MTGTILWDFDNTLFRTRTFWRKVLFPALGDLEIDAETCEKGFKHATSVKRDYFVPEIVADSIAKAAEKDAALVLKVVERIVYSDAGKQWFLPGALESVQTANQKGYRGYLLSYGDRVFKERWFASLGLGELFSVASMAITNQKKPAMIQSLKLETEVTMVNDVLEETRAVMDVLRGAGHQVRAYQFVEDVATLSAQPGVEGVTYFAVSER
jgi:phosphoglycolate phosphatase-like HAD superfamily hydrolase